ncbi:copper amine oxidase N-terminal domain-containing protein [Paenibacillus macerans]|uniref:copper amine oxidase N-terminal domain-containing protein n=1 Tax=Paenibacillus macerans TaxID=44252 RepID=UPI00203A72E2|nr:copper amine oxidase N-terminal domain-containing protein [Paenibacillus macerans]MCM3703789.1 copper amine oxidase N-terminal domain-containing protein [Paenibacillus macerans]
MKKIVAGFIAGALFMLGASSFADGISLIGKKIQSEVTVTANGSQLSDKAVVIDGKSYAPVRAIAEAAKMQVEYGKEGIVLTENVQEVRETPEAVTNPVNDTAPEPEQTTNKGKLPVNWEDDKSIKMAQEDIEYWQALIDQTTKSLSNPTSQMKNYPEDAQLLIDGYQRRIENLEKEIEERKAKLAEESK